MCRSIIYYVLLKTTMLYMCRTMCLKPINRCVEPIICATSCICDLCMNYLFIDQFLVLFNGWIFFAIVVVVISNICLVNKWKQEPQKKSKQKTINFQCFLSHTPPAGLTVLVLVYR
jgi:integral membrane sensor domain MASE1